MITITSKSMSKIKSGSFVGDGSSCAYFNGSGAGVRGEDTRDLPCNELRYALAAPAEFRLRSDRFAGKSLGNC